MARRKTRNRLGVPELSSLAVLIVIAMLFLLILGGCGLFTLYGLEKLAEIDDL